MLDGKKIEKYNIVSVKIIFNIYVGQWRNRN